MLSSLNSYCQVAIKILRGVYSTDEARKKQSEVCFQDKAGKCIFSLNGLNDVAPQPRDLGLG